MKLPQARNLRNSLYVGVPGALVGLLVGLYSRSCTPLSVRYEITAGEILNAFVTVFLALLVADYLNKRAAALRVEKDILLQECADVIRATAAVRDFARKSTLRAGTVEERRDVLSLLESAFNALETFETDLTLCKKSIGELNITPVVSALFAYKAALTGGVFPQQPLDELTYIRSERKYVECAKTLASLRFELNRR